MKKILSLLFVFSFLIGSCQRNVGDITPISLFPQSVPMGPLFDDSFNNFQNWTTTSPAGAFSVSGGNLEINKSVGGGYNFNDYTLQTNYGGSCLESWTITVPFKITEISATATGFAVGVKSTATWYSAYHHIVQFNTNIGGKKLYFYMSGATSATTISVNALTCAVNDECILVVSQTANASTGFRINATVTNITNPNSVSQFYQFGESYPQTIGVPPTSYFAVYALPGIVSLHSFSVTTDLYKNANMAAVGNSIVRGLYSGGYSTTWFHLLIANSLKRNYAMGGPGDRTETILHRINEINTINPQTLLLSVGGNDLEGGVALATVQSRYISIVNQLTKNGRTILHLKPTPRDAFDFTTWNAWLVTTYGINNVIDDWTLLKGAGTDLGATYDAGDGIHPNAAGHSAIKTAVLPFVLNKLFINIPNPFLRIISDKRKSGLKIVSARKLKQAA